METMSKNLQFFILCYKCIFWCWWARKLCEIVLGILQTRKSVKIRVTFQPIHYNSDSNTNGRLLTFTIVTSLLSSWNHCSKIDVALDLEIRFSWASSMLWSLDVFPSCQELETIGGSYAKPAGMPYPHLFGFFLSMRDMLHWRWS